MDPNVDRQSDTVQRWLPWLGAFIAVAALGWLLRGFDFHRFRTVAANADLRFLLLVPSAIIVEQIVRGWKWRQLLWPLRSIGSVYLFGAVMAGYLLAIIVPFGFGTVARSWLVARRENLKFSTVLATVVLDRLIDGIVFACLVPAAVLLIAFPDPGGVRAGLIWSGAGSLILFIALLAGLAFGIKLHPAEYLFLMVFLGFLVIIGHLGQIAGGYVIGAVFALTLLGVPQEEAVAMSLIVEASSLLSVACVGVVALWLQGVALTDVRKGTEEVADPRGP